MFERPKSGERALLVHMEVNDESHREDIGEFRELAESAGAEVMDIVTTSRHKPEPKYFVGIGKAEEIEQTVRSQDVQLVLFNHTLSPSQERNLEKLLQCRVLDRTGLILDIFAQRARSFEGKLQVELAQLKHLSTRLVRGWTHLERQKGGIGLRGPGETQLETDRRLLGMRIRQINKRLAKVRRQREQSRQSRLKAEIPTVSLVGYTNAGKSTLFNAMADDDVYVKDQLFATLDPTLRKISPSPDIDIIIADTVGFIRHLPHDLVQAFRSTLQETAEASLLLHVIDCSDERREDNIHEVESVLSQIGAGDVPCIQVMNKIDLLDGDMDARVRVDRDDAGKVKRIWISAAAGIGLESLMEVLSENFRDEMVQGELLLQPTQARIRARLFESGAILSEQIEEDGCFRLALRISKRDLEKLSKRESIELSSLVH